MKVKEGFILREVADSYVIVAVGEASRHFKGVIKVNETGAFLFRELEKGNFDTDNLAKLLIIEYKVDFDTAKEDVEAFIQSLKDGKIIE